MRHGANGRHVLQQLHVGCGRTERVVTNNGAHRLTTELAVFRCVDVLVETGLGNIRRKLEVLQQLLLGRVQDVDFDVLAEFCAVHHQFQPAPGRSEEHTSELQSRENLVCRLLLEKKKKKEITTKKNK